MPLTEGRQASKLPLVLPYEIRREVLHLLVSDKDLDGRSHVLDPRRVRHNRSTGQLVFNVLLDLFSFWPGPRICRTPLAGFAGCRPTKPLPAIASLGELIPRILATLRMPHKNCHGRRGGHCVLLSDFSNETPETRFDTKVKATR